jgi:hypothetical protein
MSKKLKWKKDRGVSQSYKYFKWGAAGGFFCKITA